MKPKIIILKFPVKFHFLVLGVFISLFPPYNLFSQESKQGVFFQRNYKDAMLQAKQNKKAVLLDFYADWCEPCKEMDSEVLTDPILSRFMNSNFVSIKINGETKEGKKQMKDYMVTGFPTYIFINKKGKIVNRISGAIDSKQFLQMGRETIDPSFSLENLRKEFIENPDSREKTLKLLSALSNEDISEISGVLDYHYFRSKKINLKNLWDDIKKFAPLNNSRCIKFARKKIEILYKYDKPESVDKWFQVTCAKTMIWAIKELDEVSFMEAKKEYGELKTKEEKQSMDVLQLEFYGKLDLEKFRQTARKLASEDWKSDWEVLNVISEQYLQKTHKQEDLEEGIRIVDQSISLLENASNLDTKALLLNKLGKKSEARHLAEKVQSLYTQDPSLYRGIELRSKTLLK